MTDVVTEAGAMQQREGPIRRSELVLLACGPAYAVSYAVAVDAVAAVLLRGYDRFDRNVSELSAIGASTRWVFVVGSPLWFGLMLAFGFGVRRVAGGSRALRVTGSLLMAFAFTTVLWLPFPMTAREEMVPGTTASNDVGHLAVAMVVVVLITAQLVAGAVAIRGWFRFYSLVSLAVVMVFGLLTSGQTGRLGSGEPTPWMGLLERINIWTWLVWLSVLSSVLMLRRPIRTDQADQHPRSARPSLRP